MVLYVIGFGGQATINTDLFIIYQALVFLCVSQHTTTPTTTMTTAQSVSAETGVYLYQDDTYSLQDCNSTLHTSLGKCAQVCIVSQPTCVGIKFDHSNNINSGISAEERKSSSSALCEVCSSPSCKLVPKDTVGGDGSDGQVTYLSFQNVFWVSQSGRWVHIQDGLHDGNVYFFTTVPDGKPQGFQFLPDNSWTTAAKGDKPYCNFNFRAEFNDGNRPDTILFDNYDKTAQSWVGPKQFYTTSDYLKVGQESQITVHVTEAAYVVFIDGVVLGSYPRPANLALSDIKYSFVTTDTKKVRW